MQPNISSLPWVVAPSIDCRRQGTLVQSGIKKKSLLETAEWILDDGRFNGVIRVIDGANGCGYAATNESLGVRAGNGCDTCLVDAPLISSIFTKESVQDALSEPKFIDKLRSRKVRIGSQANLLDLKDAGIIAKTMIEKLALSGRQVDLWVNYRRRYTNRLDELVDLCRFYGESGIMRLHISLPINRQLSVNRDFDEYSIKRRIYPETVDSVRDKFGLLNHGIIRNKVIVHGLVIEDVRHFSDCPLTHTGRGLERSELIEMGIAGEREEHGGNGLINFAQRELGNVMINPDGIWFRLLLTKMESLSALGFLRLNQANIDFAFVSLKQHPDFNDHDNSNNWPFGMIRTVDESKTEKERIVGMLNNN